MSYTINDLGWDETFCTHINTVISTEANRTRKVRGVLPLFGDEHTDPDTIPSHKIEVQESKTGKNGTTYTSSIGRGHAVVAVEIESVFELDADQTDPVKNNTLIERLATREANRVARTEDALILLGNSSLFDSELARLKVNKPKIVGEHKGLFQEQTTTVKSVLDSILLGIEELQDKGHDGCYVAVVAPDLYQQAYKPIPNSLDAPISQIRPRLREGGFLNSASVPKGTGVLFSLGGGTIDVAVPVNACLDYKGHDGNFFLRVFERVALRINDPTAVVSLKTDAVSLKTEAAKSGR